MSTEIIDFKTSCKLSVLEVRGFEVSSFTFRGQPSVELAEYIRALIMISKTFSSKGIYER